MEADNSLLSGGYMPRPRLDRVLDEAARRKLVYIIAGAGYGKTQAVQHYVGQQHDAYIRWIQLTESDNITFHYWENLTNNISVDNPGLAAKLRELGFPETLARFKQFSDILKDVEHRSQKTFLILDDFHLIHSEAALTFAERCAFLQIPGACVILISRGEPKINAVSLFSKGQAIRITEEDLRFTDDETEEFLRERDVPFSAQDIPRFAEATKGWPLAVNLLSLVLKRMPGRTGEALATMKQNIFKLMETEMWDGLPEDLQKTIVRLSLVSDLPLASLFSVLSDGEALQNAPEFTSFAWYDSLTGDYRVHPLYLEFVKSKQGILSEKEKRETWLRAARWCSENNYNMDAFNYYAKARQFRRLTETLFSYPFKLPFDACEYFLEILDGLDPDENEQNDTDILLLKNFFAPILLAGTGRYEEARGRNFDTIREWEHTDTPFSLLLLGIAYSNLSYFSMYTSTVTHRYDAPEYLKKSMHYFKKSSITPMASNGPFAVPDIRSFACLVGEGAGLAEFDEFLEASRETAVCVEANFHSMYYGYDDLAACEIAFYKNQAEAARVAAHNAIVKAREKNQYGIESMAEQYILRIATQEGDFSLAKEMLKQLRSHLDNSDFWNRQLLHDLYLCYFYSQIGLPGMGPTWFIMDEKEATQNARVPARELIVSAKYYIALKKYNQALVVLCKAAPRDPQERFVFGELTLSLLTAVAKARTGDDEGALADFEKAYQLSFSGLFEMPFIELGKNLHPLAVAALNRPDCGIPGEWLKAIGRKASVYAKKSGVVADAIKREREIGDTVSLSEREQEILNDLYHGLSYDEIAANRYLSVNTVKKALRSIYTKLDANSNIDAIRIAVEKKLIG